MTGSKTNQQAQLEHNAVVICNEVSRRLYKLPMFTESLAVLSDGEVKFTSLEYTPDRRQSNSLLTIDERGSNIVDKLAIKNYVSVKRGLIYVRR